MVDDAGAALAPADVERAVDLWVRTVAFNIRQVQTFGGGMSLVEREEVKVVLSVILEAER